MRALTSLVVACLLLAGCSGNKDDLHDIETIPGSMHLLVLSHNDLPIRNARVSVLGTDAFGDTRADGTIHFSDLPPATYEVTVQATSFLPASIEVEILADTQVNATLQLRLDPSQPENPHIHDLWRGRNIYPMMDAVIDITKDPPNERPFTPVEEPLRGMITRPNGLATDDTFFIPLVDDASNDAVIVVPGARTMVITVTWDAAKVGFDQMGIQYDPPNGNAQRTPLFSSGEPMIIDVDKEWWDDGHRTFSRWMLHGFHNNRADQPTTWTPVVVTDGSIRVMIELERGPLELDVAHPDHWDGATELVLRKAGDPRPGGTTGVGRRGMDSGLRLDEEKIVPPETKLLRIEFSWAHTAGDGQREDYDLTWRTAAQNPQTTDITEFERADAIEGSAALQHKVYEIDLGEGEGDSVYDTSTGWLFVPWMTGTPEDGYRVSGPTAFDMVVTAYR